MQNAECRMHCLCRMFSVTGRSKSITDVINEQKGNVVKNHHGDMHQNHMPAAEPAINESCFVHSRASKL